MAYNSTDDEMTHWAYSVFRTGGFNNAPLGDSEFAVDIGNVGGYSFSTRVTQLLQYEGDENLWHVGFGYDYSRLGANDAVGSGTPGNAGSPEPFYQSQTLPEFGPLGYPQNPTTFGNASNFTPPIFVDSGRYRAKDFNLFGLETVYQAGPFGFQSEYMANLVRSAVANVFYHGAYAEVLYRPTGEHRPYDKRLAAFKNVIPYQEFISFTGENAGIHGWGAWELAARISYVEVRNPSSLDGSYYNSATNKFDTTAKAGNGTLTDTTLGFTWFITSHTKFQFNWIHAFLNNSAEGFSNADLFVLRTQVDF
jgi:phosphate-selective porin OprO/OprP